MANGYPAIESVFNDTNTVVYGARTNDVSINVGLLMPYLSAAERTRWQGTDHRNQLAERASRRRLFAALADTHPADVEFPTDHNGRPSLFSPFGEVPFSTSHSGDWAYWAVRYLPDAQPSNIGVDLQVRADNIPWERLVSRHGTYLDREEIRAAPDSSFAAVAWFSRLEAICKATGYGIGSANQVIMGPAPRYCYGERFASVGFRNNDGRVTRLMVAVRNIPAPENYAAALARTISQPGQFGVGTQKPSAML